MCIPLYALHASGTREAKIVSLLRLEVSELFHLMIMSIFETKYVFKTSCTNHWCMRRREEAPINPKGLAFTACAKKGSAIPVWYYLSWAKNNNKKEIYFLFSRVQSVVPKHNTYVFACRIWGQNTLKSKIVICRLRHKIRLQIFWFVSKFWSAL